MAKATLPTEAKATPNSSAIDVALIRDGSYS